MVGLVLSLVPGVLAVPNANRCITHAGNSSTARCPGLAQLLHRPRRLGTARWHALALSAVAGMLIASRRWGYAEFPRPQRRPIYGFLARGHGVVWRCASTSIA